MKHPPQPALAPEFQIVATSANPRVSLSWLEDGSIRISDESGRAIIPAPAITPLRETLLDLAAMPHLTPTGFPFIPVWGPVELAICDNGSVVIRVGHGFAECQTVEIEAGDVGIVARALG